MGATDTNADDVGERLAGETAPRAAANFFDETAHFVQHRIDAGHDVLAVDVYGAVGAVAQGDVQHRSLFRRVQLLPAKHRLDRFGHLRLAGKAKKKRHRFIGDAIFGVVKQEVSELQ